MAWWCREVGWGQDEEEMGRGGGAGGPLRWKEEGEQLGLRMRGKVGSACAEGQSELGRVAKRSGEGGRPRAGSWRSWDLGLHAGWFGKGKDFAFLFAQGKWEGFRLKTD
jgi:hypothetical protein